MAIKNMDVMKAKKLKKKKKMQKRQQFLNNIRRQRLLEEGPQPPPEFRPRIHHACIHYVPADRSVDNLRQITDAEDICSFIFFYMGLTTTFSFGYLLASSDQAMSLFQDFMFTFFSTTLHR